MLNSFALLLFLSFYLFYNHVVNSSDLFEENTEEYEDMEQFYYENFYSDLINEKKDTEADERLCDEWKSNYICQVTWDTTSAKYCMYKTPSTKERIKNANIQSCKDDIGPYECDSNEAQLVVLGSVLKAKQACGGLEPSLLNWINSRKQPSQRKQGNQIGNDAKTGFATGAAQSAAAAARHCKTFGCLIPGTIGGGLQGAGQSVIQNHNQRSNYRKRVPDVPKKTKSNTRKRKVVRGRQRPRRGRRVYVRRGATHGTRHGRGGKRNRGGNRRYGRRRGGRHRRRDD